MLTRNRRIRKKWLWAFSSPRYVFDDGSSSYNYVITRFILVVVKGLGLLKFSYILEQLVIQHRYNLPGRDSVILSDRFFHGAVALPSRTGLTSLPGRGRCSIGAVLAEKQDATRRWRDEATDRQHRPCCYYHRCDPRRPLTRSFGQQAMQSSWLDRRLHSVVASRRRRGRSADTCRHLLNMLVQLNVVLALGIINTTSVLKRTLHDQTNQLANSATYSTLVLVSQSVRFKGASS